MQQLAQDRSNPSQWFDYGVLYMSLAEHMKGKQCFYLAVSVNQAHIPRYYMGYTE